MRAVALALCALSLTLLLASEARAEKMVVCYWGTWAVYRWSDGKFDVENIDPYICTHIIYTFVGLGQDNRMRLLDEYYDLEENWGKGAMKRLNALKQLNPKLKTILAVGGWNEGSEQYSKMAESAASRAVFIQSVLEFLPREGFDGFDLDWEYPAHRGGRPQDKENFSHLAREMKAAFRPHGYLLSAAVAAGANTIRDAYEISKIAQDFDFINVMAYDFHGFWDGHHYTHHHSPLFEHPLDAVNNNSLLSSSQAVDIWLDSGLAKEKLVLGLPAYGKGWNLDDRNNNGIYAPASNGIDAGTYTQQPGMWGYNELCFKMQNEAGQWTVVRDEHLVAPYAYNGNKWIGYDDIQSIQSKAKYVLDKGLAGAMFWSLETDDFNGLCGGEKFPLVKAAYRVLNGEIVVPPPETTTTTTTTVDPEIPTEETTTTTTTTSTSTVAPGPICKHPGNNADPDKPCSARYYNCVQNGSGYDVYPVDCAGGTIFNPYIARCDYVANVEGCH